MIIAAFLRQFAPDFCWMTIQDLFLMAEQHDEMMDINSFSATVCRLHSLGVFVSRPWPHAIRDSNSTMGKRPRQYLRVKKPC